MYKNMVHTLQMIGLYRDPTGEKVFEDYDGKSSSKTNGKGVISSVIDSADTLRKRVKHLEEVLSSNVC